MKITKQVIIRSMPCYYVIVHQYELWQKTQGTATVNCKL